MHDTKISSNTTPKDMIASLLLKLSSVIFFSDSDLPLERKAHNKPLFIQVIMRAKKTSCVMVDNGSAIKADIDLGIDVCFDGKILSVYSPLTFKRGYQKKNFICNYLLAKQIEKAMQDYEKDKGISFYKIIEPPFVCVMIRKNYHFSINAVCDGDNLENQKIINALTATLSLPDNAKNMDLYSKWEIAKPDEKEGMYFKIMSRKHLLQYLQSANEQEA